MMAGDGLFKEFGEAFGRLFDHRPVIQGEINFCQREFEEKRGNREEARLQKCLEYGREINEKLIPQTIESLQTEFPKFRMSVVEAISLSQQIMDKENIYAKSEWLEERRLQRSSDWSEFLDTMTTRVSDIDSEFANEVALVIEHYRELEEKLKITDRKERPQVAQHNKTENEEERVGISEKEVTDVVEDNVTAAHEAKVGDGQEGDVVEDNVTTAHEAKVGDGQEGDRVEITQKDKVKVDCNEEIAEATAQSVQENKAAANNSSKIAKDEVVTVAQDDQPDILSNSYIFMKDGKEIDMDKNEID